MDILQFEQDLTYKAQAIGSQVLKVKPDYTSQRCPKCGRIQKGIVIMTFMSISVTAVDIVQMMIV